jgi:prepilin-type N-terminal cleavage/methylation domain-containing protein
MSPYRRRVLRSLSETARHDEAMPTGSRTGRPSKGDRRVVFSRHPRAQADVIEELARARGLTLTEVMVALTAVGLNHLSEAQLPPEREVLPETA